MKRYFRLKCLSSFLGMSANTAKIFSRFFLVVQNMLLTKYCSVLYFSEDIEYICVIM